MELSRKKIEMDTERKLVMYSIQSDHFLKSIFTICSPSLLKTKFAQTVYGWCATHYSEYGHAPNKTIQDIYLAHKGNIEGEVADLILTFLQSLSDESDSEAHNIDFYVTKCTNYLQMRSLEVMREQLDAAIQSKDYRSGEAAISSFKRVEVQKSKVVDVFDSDDIVRDAFMSESEELFRFEGAMGQICGPAKRGEFFAWAAKQKTGKSWAMQKIATQAVKRGNNTLYITLEMTQPEIFRRIYKEITVSPSENVEARIPYFYKDDENNEEEKWSIDYYVEKRTSFVPSKQVLDEFKKDWFSYYNKGSLRALSLPAKSATFSDIKILISNLIAYEDWVPDVVVIDYLDLLKTKGSDYRVGLGEMWAEARGYALEQNIFLASATQLNRGSNKVAVADETHVAEDISKLAHVTRCIALNASKSESEKGFIRLSQLAVREGRTYSGQVLCLTCLDIGQMFLDSQWIDSVDFGEQGE